MADDTRVTHSRPGFACALALLCVLGCALPAEALASDIIVRRDPGLTRRRAGRRARRRRGRARADAAAAEHRAGERPGRREERALATLNADPDVRFAAPGRRRATPPADASTRSSSLGGRQRRRRRRPRGVGVDAEGLGVTVAVADMSIDAEHPDLLGQRRARQPRTSSAPTAVRRPRPTGIADHGTHVAGLIAALRERRRASSGVAPLAHVHAAARARQLRRRQARPASWRRSTTPATTQHADRRRRRSRPTRCCPAETAERSTTPFTDRVRGQPRTRCTWSPPATRATTTTTRSTRLPAAATTAENMICVGMTDATDKPVCWGNVGEASVDLFAPGMKVVLDGARPRSRYLPLERHVDGRRRWSPRPRRCWRASDPLTYGPEDLKQALLDAVDYVPGLDAFSGVRRAPERGAAAASAASRPRRRRSRRRRGRRATPTTTASATVRRQVPGRGRPGRTAARTPTATGVRDLDDNCPTRRERRPGGRRRATGSATRATPTPRGDDVDGDAKAALDDRCPTRPAPTADGCPVDRRPAGPPTPPVADPDAAAAARRRRPARRGSSRVKVAVRCARRQSVPEGGEGHGARLAQPHVSR